MSKIKDLGTRKFIVTAYLALAIGLLPTSAVAGDLTVQTKIVSLRGYVNGAYFVTLATAAMAPGSLFPTCTTVYKVNDIQPGKDVVIASAIAAHITGKDVQIEISPAGCSGYATLITSIFVY